MPSYRAFRQIKNPSYFYYAIWRLFRQILFPSNFPAIRYAGVRALTNDRNYVTIVPSTEMSMMMKSKMAKLSDESIEEEEEVEEES